MLDGVSPTASCGELYYVDDNDNLILVSANPKRRNFNVFVAADSGSSVRACGKVLLGKRIELPDYLFDE